MLSTDERQKRRNHKLRLKHRTQNKFKEHIKTLIIKSENNNAFERFEKRNLPEGNEFIWDHVPNSLDTQTYNLSGNRGLRKRNQAESFARAMKPVINEYYRRLNRRIKIIDFGCGTGNGSLPLAFWFKDKVDFTLIDRFEEPIRIVKERIKLGNLTNVKAKVQYIKDFTLENNHFDIGFSSHGCGSATDEALLACLYCNASFVMIPCCVGKLKHSQTADYPKSEWMKSFISREEYLALSQAGDHSACDFDDESMNYRREAKLLLEIDRLAHVKETNLNYDVCLMKLHPLDCTVRNDIISGQITL